VRAPVDHIHAPPFPRHLEWVNVATLRLDQQRGRPVLVEFSDVFRPSCLRTLEYLKAWHARYAADGLRVVSVLCPGFPPARDGAAVRAELARLRVEHPVALDPGFELWRLYDNEGWPSRYLFGGDLTLREFHFGEGAYAETERALQALLGVQRAPLAPLRAEDDPAARLVVPTPEQRGAYSGPYVAGEVWAVLSGRGELRVDGRAVAVERDGAHLLVRHAASAEGVLELEPGPGVTCHATLFSAGLAPPRG
jgi:hypothetical protein